MAVDGAVQVKVQDAEPALIVLGVVWYISVVPFSDVPVGAPLSVPTLTDKSKPAAVLVLLDTLAVMLYTDPGTHPLLGMPDTVSRVLLLLAPWHVLLLLQPVVLTPVIPVLFDESVK